MTDAGVPAVLDAAGLQAVGPVKVAIHRLSFYYGENQALRDISVAVPDRRVTAFIGPSGCGKSTLLRVLNRI